MAGLKDAESIAGMDNASVLEGLKVDPGKGLDPGVSRARLAERGYNEVPEKRENPLLRFLGKFWGVTAWMLEAIIVLSVILNRQDDLYIVSGLLVFNAILSFVQEQRAMNAVETLKKRLQVMTRVMRGGTWAAVPARELVPGDIVRVRGGDFVPADMKILSGEVRVDESALTGESMEKDRRERDVVYSGSVVGSGEATGVVVLTGADTYFGKTAQLVQIARPKLHIEDVVSEVSRQLLIIVAALLIVAFAFSLDRGIDPVEILPLMLVLLLGAVPVALPAMFTISMAIGSMELVKKGVLVTRLSAPDDAASMDILCVDKTGTITMNRLTVAEVEPSEGFSGDDVLLFGALASEEANHDPIDMAFINAAKGKGLPGPSFVREGFTPFDPKTRMTEAAIRKGRKGFRVMKGSVAAIGGACGLDIAELEGKMAGFAEKGYRTLAVARSEGGKPRLAGLVALHDPLRPDSKELVKELGDLGVSVKLLTGDAHPIARAIGEEVGLKGEVMKVAHLKEYFENDPQKAAEAAERSSGFAEIYPGDKYIIVKSLQGRGHVVGMTGDGVNDAPALRQAEVGMAVSNATDVAKGAASVVLTGEGLPHMIEPIKTGRLMFKRINTWILNKITRTVLKTCFIVIAFLVTGKYIISSSAILLMIFMTDFVKITLSTDNVKMSMKPDVWNITGLTKVAAILGLVMVVEAFGLLYLGDRLFGVLGNDSLLHTFSFETLFFFAMFSIFVVRERGHFWDSMPSTVFLSAILLDMALGLVFSTYGLLGLAAVPLQVTALVFGYAFVFPLVVNDFIKRMLVGRIGWQ